MKLTYYGHSCFLVDTGTHRLLFDPFISGNDLAKAVDKNDIDCDFILLSHFHQDHVLDAADIAKKTGAMIICAFEGQDWFGKEGIDNIHPMNTGGRRHFDFGVVKCVVAQHSSVFPDGTYGANPMGFVVITPNGSFYYAGDTALTMDMKLIPMWATVDFAVLPIGDNFTMGAEDAAVAATWVETKKVVGVHYDTFGYIVVDKEEAKSIFTEKQVELLLPEIGSTIEL